MYVFGIRTTPPRRGARCGLAGALLLGLAAATAGCPGGDQGAPTPSPGSEEAGADAADVSTPDARDASAPDVAPTDASVPEVAPADTRGARCSRRGPRRRRDRVWIRARGRAPVDGPRRHLVAT